VDVVRDAHRLGLRVLERDHGERVAGSQEAFDAELRGLCRVLAGRESAGEGGPPAGERSHLASRPMPQRSSVREVKHPGIVHGPATVDAEWLESIELATGGIQT
jgi:hypothetical protein